MGGVQRQRAVMKGETAVVPSLAALGLLGGVQGRVLGLGGGGAWVMLVMGLLVVGLLVVGLLLLLALIRVRTIAAAVAGIVAAAVVAAAGIRAAGIGAVGIAAVGIISIIVATAIPIRLLFWLWSPTMPMP